MKTPSLSSPDRLLQTLHTFIRAETWHGSKRVLEQHQELLTDAADALLEQLISTQTNKWTVHMLHEHRELLRRCRVQEMDTVFANLVRAAFSTTPGGFALKIPAEFKTDVKKARELAKQAQLDPSVRRKRVALLEGVLRRLNHGEYPAFQAATLYDLGNSYADLPTGDRITNSQRAIACYQEALQYYSAEAAPLDYASIQNNLGEAYRNMPIGSQAANLQQAISCYQEALRFYTPETTPLDYAMIQYNLGIAYSDFPGGDSTANLQQATSCYQEALRFYTPETTPLDYAMTQNNLGTAYFQLLAGDRAVNLRQAISCYQEALRFYTPETAPLDYAMTQNNLGAAYAGLPSRDSTANLQQAISCYQEALRFYTPETTPLDYAMTLYSMGNAYAKLFSGDPAANLQQAISCYQEALRFYTPETAPLEYAGAKHNLGNAYYALPAGSQAANLQQAISCYQEALRFYTPETTPLEYAGAKHNLGNAYGDLPSGDRTANLQQAISCYQEALRFYTPETAPLDYAMTQNNLGVVCSDLPSGDRTANLQQAISCYQEALRFRTPETAPLDYAMTQNNLGSAYYALPAGSQAANLQQAISCYQEALRFYTPETAPLEYAGAKHNLGNAYYALPSADRAANLRQAISCYQEALRFRTPETVPLHYATTQNNLGLAYADFPTRDRAANLQQAISCYQEALRFRTLEAAPGAHRATNRHMGDLHLRERRWHEAHIAYNSGIAAGEALYLAAATGFSRQAELAEAVDIFLNDAYCLARLGRLTEAVERLEAGKARALAEALARDRIALEQAIPEDRVAFEAARARVKELEVEARSIGSGSPRRAMARTFADLSSDLGSARQQLAATVHRIRTYVHDFMPAGLDFKAIAAAALPVRPLAYLISTSLGGLALIVPQGAETLSVEHAVWLDEFRVEDLDQLLVAQNTDGEVVGGYLVGQVGGDMPFLHTALEQILPILEQRLMTPLLMRLVELGYRQVTLIPSGRLGLLPLHAVGVEAVISSYAPSARVLRAASSIAGERDALPPVLLGIANPLPNPQPLAFARIEVEDIEGFFTVESRRVFYEQQATRTAVLRALLNTTHLHFSCHGTFNIEEPLDSALWLAGQDQLTLRNLLDSGIALTTARLAVLSACQTGIIDFRHVPDEAVGFSAGFLHAGVAGVITTLWPVADISTAILLVRFYHHHLVEQLDPATALQQAQQWLRNATAQQMALAEYWERCYQASGRRDAHAWRAMRYHRVHPSERPFAHPYYWAAFTFSGA